MIERKLTYQTGLMKELNNNIFVNDSAKSLVNYRILTTYFLLEKQTDKHD